MADKIPYYIRYNETSSISNRDFLYYDNNTDTAQSITYADLLTQLENDLVVTATTDYKTVFLFQGC